MRVRGDFIIKNHEDHKESAPSPFVPLTSKYTGALAALTKGTWPVTQSHDRSQYCMPPRSKWRTLLEESENRK